MENEVREHLNLALYNFNRMAVIDEETVPIDNSRAKRREDIQFNDQQRPHNMHNTTSGFYP
jgi:hypothetical protein